MGRAFLRGAYAAYGRLFAPLKALALIPLLAGAAQAQPVTLLAFGDSLTQGYGLPQADGFVPQMEAWLKANGADVTLVNGGVSGDTTAGGAARIAWSLTDQIDGVIVALGGNDLLRGIAPEETHANLDAILTEIEARHLPALLVGMAATGNFGQAYKAQFDAIYPGLAAAHQVPLFPQFLQGLVDIGDQAKVLRDDLQADATHPNAAGVKLVVARMGPAVLDLVHRAEK